MSRSDDNPLTLALGQKGVPIALTHMKTLQSKIYANAFNKGWYEEERTFGDRIALCHSELSEALEHFREGRGLNETFWIHDESCVDAEDGNYYPTFACSCNPKPDGVPIELADVIIRILDMSEAEGIDMGEAIHHKMHYNETRPHRHGGKAL